MLDLMYDLPSRDDLTECTITEAVVRGEAPALPPAPAREDDDEGETPQAKRESA